MTKQLNLNTLLILFVGALVTFGITKMDTLNTAVIRTATKLENVIEEIRTLHQDDQNLQREIDIIIKKNP